MKRYDANTIKKIGIDGLVLMERAALSVKDRIMELRGERKNPSVFLLAGVGNNGADGLALSRMLVEEGFLVEVCVQGNPDKATPSWKKQRRILNAYPINWTKKPEQKNYDFVIDGLFGVGLSRDITGEFSEKLQIANACEGYHIALDIPSGIHADNGAILGACFKAQETITFGFLKRGLVLYPGCEACGKVTVAQIGIHERAFFGKEPGLFTYREEPQELLPKRKKAGNKGSFGKALLVCGSAGMAGAAILSAKACFRTGAGMCKVITSFDNRVILQESIPEVMIGTGENLEEAMNWATVTLIGPGIGKSPEAIQNLSFVLKTGCKPLVIDADGINLLAEQKSLLKQLLKAAKEGRTIVLTPHCMELLRLYNSLFQQEATMEELKTDILKYAKMISEKCRCIVVAKDARTYVVRPKGNSFLNLRGNSGMAVAGSGDVLAGIIVSLLAQGMDGFLGACAGVSLHGYAGDLASHKYGEHACMPTDIIEALYR